MPAVLALGSSPFVRPLMLGGTLGRVIAPAAAADGLRAALEQRDVELILFDAALVPHLPPDLHRLAFYSRHPEVVVLGGPWNEVLRRRIMQVLGADLLAERKPS